MQPISNTVDWSATAAWIALALSIITPTISLILNNLHQRKLKKIELMYKTEMEYYHLCKNAYEEFINQASLHILTCTGNTATYYQTYQNLFLYVPSKYWENLRALSQSVESFADNRKDLLDEIIKILASLLQERQRRMQELSCMPTLLTSIRNRLRHANRT